MDAIVDSINVEKSKTKAKEIRKATSVRCTHANERADGSSVWPMAIKCKRSQNSEITFQTEISETFIGEAGQQHKRLGK